MAHNIPNKADFMSEKQELLRQLYVVACLNALSPTERKQVFAMFNLVPAPRTRD